MAYHSGLWQKKDRLMLGYDYYTCFLPESSDVTDYLCWHCCVTVQARAGKRVVPKRKEKEINQGPSAVCFHF